MKSGNGWEYKLTSTVIVAMKVQRAGLGSVNLSGSVAAQKTKVTNEEHMATMGSMIEDLELSLRNAVEGIYIQKTKEIVNGMRLNDPYQKSRAKQFASVGAAAVAKSMRTKKPMSSLNEKQE